MPGREPIVVFDIETVPDEHHNEGAEFPKLPFHQIVAISYLEARTVEAAEGKSLEITTLKSGGTIESTEQQLVSGLFRYIEQRRPRLVTFNGRGFDFPVLKYRAMKHGISAPWFACGEGRWENYGHRYGVDWHCDIMDALADFGASKPAKLSEICTMLGIPNKLGVDGSQVDTLVKAGRLADVRNYCETDVLATFILFLRYALFRGELSPEEHVQSVAAVIRHLDQNRTERPHLGEFADAWVAR